MEVDIQNILPVLEYVVGVAAHNHAGPFLCKLENNLALDIPKKIRGGKTVHDSGNPLGRKGVGEYAAAGGVLAMLFDKFGSKTGFLGNMLYQLFVVERNTQFFGNQPAHRKTAGTVFSADGDDLFFHNHCLLTEWLLSL